MVELQTAYKIISICLPDSKLSGTCLKLSLTIACFRYTQYLILSFYLIGSFFHFPYLEKGELSSVTSSLHSLFHQCYWFSFISLFSVPLYLFVCVYLFLKVDSMLGVELSAGPEPTTLRSSQIPNWWSHPGAPHLHFLKFRSLSSLLDYRKCFLNCFLWC